LSDTTENTPRGPGRPRIADRPPQHIPAAEGRQAAHDPVHTEPRTRTRMRRTSVMDDPFYIPVDEIPEGSSYEWKRFSVNGQEDPFYLAQMRRQGWEPVDPCKHPTWVPPGYSLPNIIKGGMLLMERPSHLTEEAKLEARQMAMSQISEAEERLGKTPKDTLTREHPGVKPKIHKEWNRPISTAIED
jgi:hypothetical protein